MVGRYAVTDQAERHRQPIDDRDLDIDVGLLAQSLGSVNTRWPRPDDRNDERGALRRVQCSSAVVDLMEEALLIS